MSEISLNSLADSGGIGAGDDGEIDFFLFSKGMEPIQKLQDRLVGTVVNIL